MSVSVQSQCQSCNNGMKPHHSPHDGAVMHGLHYFNGHGWLPAPGNEQCGNYDDECRHIAEPLGFSLFAFTPKRCRNGRWRWLRFVEKHPDGTFTLNRAG